MAPSLSKHCDTTAPMVTDRPPRRARGIRLMGTCRARLGPQPGNAGITPRSPVGSGERMHRARSKRGACGIPGDRHRQAIEQRTPSMRTAGRSSGPSSRADPATSTRSADVGALALACVRARQPMRLPVLRECAEECGVSLKTAWYMRARLRHAQAGGSDGSRSNRILEIRRSILPS